MSYGQFQQPPYPPQHGGFPPQQGGFPPQHGFHQGPPPPHGQHHGGFGGPPPQQQPFGYGPPQGFGFPSLPSPGYDLHAPFPPGDAGRDADALRGAMKGFGTDEKTLIRVLSKPDPNQMRLLNHAYSTRFKRNLEADVKKETSRHLEDGLLALIRGPLAQDVYLLNKGLQGIGTNESYLNDVLCGRSNADINAIKAFYQQKHNQSLLAAVKKDLSLKTETLFEMILSATRAEESAPYDPQAIERDVVDLQRAMTGSVTTDQLTVCSILTSRSDGQIRGIALRYREKFHELLPAIIKKKFTGHMEDALMLIVGRADDPAMTAADQLHDAMQGAVLTDKDLLIERIVRCHWDRAAMDQVKRAYKNKYKKDLIFDVREKTSGDLEKLLVACLE